MRLHDATIHPLVLTAAAVRTPAPAATSGRKPAGPADRVGAVVDGGLKLTTT
jgi:hypothetical protein